MPFRMKLLIVLLPMVVVSTGAIFAHGSSCELGSFFISNAWADNCTNWMRQNNGCSERVCVDNRGQRYCQQSCKGRISRIRC
jgi:hypothetical protein